MTQLSFLPALDPFHTVFRIIRLFSIIQPHGGLPFDTVRILDFYMLSPFLIKDIRLSPKLQKYRKISERYDHLKPYGDQAESGLLFQRMEPIQKAAVQTLAARSLLDTDALKRLNEVRPLSDKIPSEIAKRAAEANEQQSDLMDFLAVLTSEYPLAGENGLKARTKLMEHRYDAV